MSLYFDSVAHPSKRRRLTQAVVHYTEEVAVRYRDFATVHKDRRQSYYDFAYMADKNPDFEVDYLPAARSNFVVVVAHSSVAVHTAETAGHTAYMVELVVVDIAHPAKSSAAGMTTRHKSAPVLS